MVLVSVCAADSELGTVQPIREIGTILKEYPNCRFHVDATQAVGKAELVLDGVDTFHAPTMWRTTAVPASPATISVRMRWKRWWKWS